MPREDCREDCIRDCTWCCIEDCREDCIRDCTWCRSLGRTKKKSKPSVTLG